MNRKTIILGLATIVACGFAVALAMRGPRIPGVDPRPEPSSATDASTPQEEFATRTRFYLGMPTGGIPVGRTVDALRLLDGASATLNGALLRPEAFASVAGSGAIVGWLGVGTSVSAKEPIEAYAIHVRVTDGPNAGLEGWVPSRYIEAAPKPQSSERIETGPPAQTFGSGG